MARHSHVDRRAKRTIPRQCVSDYGHGVHKDAPKNFTKQPSKIIPAKWPKYALVKRSD